MDIKSNLSNEEFSELFKDFAALCGTVVAFFGGLVLLLLLA